MATVARRAYFCRVAILKDKMRGIANSMKTASTSIFGRSRDIEHWNSVDTTIRLRVLCPKSVYGVALEDAHTLTGDVETNQESQDSKQ